MAGNPAAGCSCFHGIVRIFLQCSKGTVRYSPQIIHGPSTYGRSKLTGNRKAFRVQSIAFCQSCLRSNPDIPSFIYNHLFFCLIDIPKQCRNQKRRKDCKNHKHNRQFHESKATIFSHRFLYLFLYNVLRPHTAILYFGNFFQILNNMVFQFSALSIGANAYCIYSAQDLRP